MNRFLIVVTVAVASTGSVRDARAQAVPGPEEVRQVAQLAAGSIRGIVVDDRGSVLAGARVSALGVMMASAVTDASGQFALEGLPPGPYLVRAHLVGYRASAREIVELEPNDRIELSWLRLSRTTEVTGSLGTKGREPPPVMTAGIASATQVDDEAVTSEAVTSDEQEELTETAWYLRHLPRNVLRDTTTQVAGIAGSDPAGEPSGFGGSPVGSRAAGPSTRLASALTSPPLAGQVNLLTTGSFDSPQDLFSNDGLPRGIAFMSVGAPTGEWSVEGAMTQGDVSSWILAGSFVSRPTSEHVVAVDMSYSTQRYEGGNPVALAAVRDGARNVGAVSAVDRWSPSKRAAIVYGGRFEHYDYIAGPGLFSPRLGLEFSPHRRAQVRVNLSQRMVAPGAEEFLPSSIGGGIRLPPERTFSAVAEDGKFRAERTRHADVELEYQLSRADAVAVRRFYQRVDDQLATFFGVRLPDGPVSDLGHYYVAAAGGVSAEGWGVRLSHSVSERMRGSVEYALTTATWRPSPETAAVSAWAPSASRRGTERFHDVTTSVETDIPETGTRVYVLYKMNTAFSHPDISRLEPRLASRFNVRVTQGLPILQSTSTEWQVLVAVRNLFREVMEGSSAYDELLIVRPPKRIVGGLMVRF